MRNSGLPHSRPTCPSSTLALVVFEALPSSLHVLDLWWERQETKPAEGLGKAEGPEDCFQSPSLCSQLCSANG